MNKTVLTSLLFATCIPCLINSNSFAQDTTVVMPKQDTTVVILMPDTTFIIPPPKWRFVLQPYLMLPNMTGTIGLGELPDADLNANSDDIFSHIQFGAMLYIEMYWNKWAFSSDLLYMHLEEDISNEKDILTGRADAKQLGWEVAALRKLMPWLELGAGLRVNVVKSAVEMSVDSTLISGPKNRAAELRETWVDPIIIGRIRLPLTVKCLVQLRADVGGFGIGSELAWQVQADISYRISRTFQLAIGYRAIDVDFEKGSGMERFKYDINTFGPVIKFGFSL